MAEEKVAEEREHLAAAAVALAPKVGAMLEEIAGTLPTERLTCFTSTTVHILTQILCCRARDAEEALERGQGRTRDGRPHTASRPHLADPSQQDRQKLQEAAAAAAAAAAACRE